jgi:hypothetical protein
VWADDLLPRRSGPGRRPKLTDAELIALAAAQVFLDCPNDRRFLGFARWRLGHLFAYLPRQPGYNKRVRALAPQIIAVVNALCFCCGVLRSPVAARLDPDPLWPIARDRAAL